MSMSDSILTILNIQDKNIHFDDDFVEEVHSNDKISIDFKAILTYDTPSFCTCCGAINKDNSIVKNGTTKPYKTVLPAISGRNTYLHLRKQCWFCRNCESTFSATSPIVDKNCYISRNTKLAVRLESKKKLSQKDIAENLNISHGTVNSLLSSSYN